MLEKLDRMEAWLVRIEQRMSAFEMRQSQFESHLREVGRKVRERV